MSNVSAQQAAEILRLIPGAIAQSVETEQAIAILDVEADIKQRVFKDGQDVEGGKIGSYSTEPMYISIEGARLKYGSQIPTSKLAGRGKPKNGKRTGKTRTVINDEGEKVTTTRRSMYFEDGYSGFRSLMDRPVDKVNLKLTGNMAGSIASGTDRNVSTVAWTNEKASELSASHEKRYGRTIFRASEKEVDALVVRLREAAESALQSLLP